MAPKVTCDYINPRTKLRCHRAPRYSMNMVVDGEQQARWVQLCATCDKNQGRLHLMQQGWPHEDTIKWERDPDHRPSKLLESIEADRAIRNVHSKPLGYDVPPSTSRIHNFYTSINHN